MQKETVKKEEIQEKEKQPVEIKKPEGSNWNTSTPPGYREEM